VFNDYDKYFYILFALNTELKGAGKSGKSFI